MPADRALSAPRGRTLVALCAAAFVAACGSKDGGPGTTETGTPVPDLAFNENVNATGIEGEVDAGDIEAQHAANVLFGAVSIAVADPLVRSKLQDHVNDARAGECWSLPPFPLSSFTIDYTGCSQIGVSGGTLFNQDPLGPVSLDFQMLTFNTTSRITGAIGLDPEPTVNGVWQAYDTIGDTPIMYNRAPFALELDGASVSMSFSGAARLRTVMSEDLSMWGIADVTSGATTRQVLLGSSDPVAAAALTAPAEPALSGFDYLSCRCPTSGMIALQVAYDVDAVTFDLDDLLTTEDEIDDPEAKIATVDRVTGLAEVRHNGCGTNEVTFVPDGEMSVVLDSAQLSAAIQGLCDTALISDDKRCSALLAAASAVGSVTVEVTSPKIATSVQNRAAVTFDTAYCHP